MDIAKGASSDARRIALRDGIARRKPLARNNQRLLLFCAVQSDEPHSGLVAFDNFIRHGRPYVPVPSSPPVARIVLSRFIIDPRTYSYTPSQVRRPIHGRHVCKPWASPGELSSDRRVRMRGKLRESRSQLSDVLVRLFPIIFHPVQQIGT